MSARRSTRGALTSLAVGPAPQLVAPFFSHGGLKDQYDAIPKVKTLDVHGDFPWVAAGDEVRAALVVVLLLRPRGGAARWNPTVFAEVPFALSC